MPRQKRPRRRIVVRIPTPPSTSLYVRHTDMFQFSDKVSHHHCFAGASSQQATQPTDTDSAPDAKSAAIDTGPKRISTGHAEFNTGFKLLGGRVPMEDEAPLERKVTTHTE